MKRFLVVADSFGSEQRIVKRAVDMASRMPASVFVVGFVYEHLKNLPVPLEDSDVRRVQESLVDRHRANIQNELSESATNPSLESRVEVYWEKRVADRVNRMVEEQEYDLVMKSANRSETILYTPTDWQLLRGSRAPVFLVARRRWKRGKHVMAAVDLGTKVRSKLALNYKIVEEASAMATALDCQLHVGYAIPFSNVLRDLDVLDTSELRRESIRRADAFRCSLAERGIDIEGIHVVTGPPEKALVNVAARNRIGLVVLGCVGRKKLAGRVMGNTAEQILRLMRADVLAIKPGR